MPIAQIQQLMQRGHWDDAIHACLSVLQIQPTLAPVHGYLGLCYFRKGQFAEAIDPLKRATILDPGYVDAAVKLAQAYQRLGRYLEAYEVARDFLPLRPDDPTLSYFSREFESASRVRRTDGWERTVRLDTVVIEHERS